MIQRKLVDQPLDPSYRYIPLTQNQIAIVDAGDYEWLNQWKWYAWLNVTTGEFQAVRHGSPKQFLYMSRVIMGATPEQEVDHANRNSLDNRRFNLRFCTRSENSANRRLQSNNKTGYRGVWWDQSKRKWKASISVNKRTYNLGRFGTKEEAAARYNDAATKAFGKFANLNILLLRRS